MGEKLRNRFSFSNLLSSQCVCGDFIIQIVCLELICVSLKSIVSYFKKYEIYVFPVVKINLTAGSDEIS